MSKKYYAVRVGRKPGIYTDWESTKEQVEGFSNAVYQSFKTRTDAENFLDGNNDSNKKNAARADQIKSFSQSGPNFDSIAAYVDGSFDKATKRYSFGVVFIQEQEVVETLSRVGNNPKYQGSWQIAGEVFGALHAIQWAIKNNYKNITIYYDYMGIEKWALGEWQTNKPVSIDYVEAFNKLKTQINIHFEKVKAHSGEEFNELVDQVAKDALKNTPVD